MTAPTFTKEQLGMILDGTCRPKDKNDDLRFRRLAAFALALLERAEKAEKRMKAWGCPDEDFICYVCGRETPCMTEADLRPGDPGIPCTFDLTYPQMIERLRHHEDRQRKAEAERDEARAMKVPATTEAVTLAEMGEKVARTEAWAAKEELRIAEAERDRLREELREAEEAILDLTDSGDAMRFSMPNTALAGKARWDASRRNAAVRRARERAGRG